MWARSRASAVRTVRLWSSSPRLLTLKSILPAARIRYDGRTAQALVSVRSTLVRDGGGTGVDVGAGVAVGVGVTPGFGVGVASGFVSPLDGASVRGDGFVLGASVPGFWPGLGFAGFFFACCLHALRAAEVYAA